MIEVSKDASQLRWFLVAPDVRKQGLGKRLLNEALAFAREGSAVRIVSSTMHSQPSRVSYTRLVALRPSCMPSVRGRSKPVPSARAPT
jgi:GNAT superfamily N-acetyltransferase